MNWTVVGYVVGAVLVVGAAAVVTAARATWGMRDGQDSERPTPRRTR